MKRYKVICHPSVNRYSCTVEASSIEEAVRIAEEEAAMNCYFMADESEIEEEL